MAKSSNLNLKSIADSVAARIYRMPGTGDSSVDIDSAIRDACDFASGGELNGFALNMLCDMVSRRIEHMRIGASLARSFF